MRLSRMLSTSPGSGNCALLMPGNVMLAEPEGDVVLTRTLTDASGLLIDADTAELTATFMLLAWE